MSRVVFYVSPGRIEYIHVRGKPQQKRKQHPTSHQEMYLSNNQGFMRFWSTFGSLFDCTCWSLKPGHLVDVQPTWTSHLASRHLICILFNQEWGNISLLYLQGSTSKMPDCFSKHLAKWNPNSSPSPSTISLQIFGGPKSPLLFTNPPFGARWGRGPPCVSAIPHWGLPRPEDPGRFRPEKILDVPNCYFKTPRKFKYTIRKYTIRKGEACLPTIHFSGANC